MTRHVQSSNGKTQVYLHAGKTIFSEGEPADSVFGHSQGVVRLYKLLPDGQRQVLAFALPGNFLGNAAR